MPLLLLEYWITRKNSEQAQPVLTWLEERIDKNNNYRQHIDLEIKKAQLKLIDGQLQTAIDLLVSIESLAESPENNEALVEINNTIAELYLYEKPEKALTVIEENKHLNAVEYPYLMLYSKALKSNGELENSLALAVTCKNKAGQH